jgi:5-methylcytosine-specific restriction protein A
LEAHHIIALCDSGRDTVDNVIALCPQHHRQAHYGKDAESLESEFIKILEKLNSKS